MNTQESNASRFIIIMSAELSTLSAAANAQRTRELAKTLGILSGLGGAITNVTKVEGCYKGSKEASFLVTIDNNEFAHYALWALNGTANFFGQESILKADTVNGRYVSPTLVFMDGSSDVSIGKCLAFVTQEEAEAEHDAYTLFPLIERALVAK